MSRMFWLGFSYFAAWIAVLICLSAPEPFTEDNLRNLETRLNEEYFHE